MLWLYSVEETGLATIKARLRQKLQDLHEELEEAEVLQKAVEQIPVGSISEEQVHLLLEIGRITNTYLEDLVGCAPGDEEAKKWQPKSFC